MAALLSHEEAMISRSGDPARLNAKLSSGWMVSTVGRVFNVEVCRDSGPV